VPLGFEPFFWSASLFINSEVVSFCFSAFTLDFAIVVSPFLRASLGLPSVVQFFNAQYFLMFAATSFIIILRMQAAKLL